MAFAQPHSLRRCRVFLSYGTSYDWWLEQADSQADMDARAGSWAVVTPTHRLPSGTWGESALSSPVNARLFRLNAKRYGGDNYWPLNEWELYGDVTVDRLEISPANPLALFTGESRRLRAVGRNLAANESYFVDDRVTWEVSDAIGTSPSCGKTW